jgi:predicted DNA-binding transcriptional regulator AlpA
MQTAPHRLRTREAAKYVGLSKSTLDKFRLEGGGPVYIKLGRAVVYDAADLDAWCAASRRVSTGENGAVNERREAALV